MSKALHLWLGLLSGIVVFIVCITGCLYAFKDQIRDFAQPWKFVEPQELPALLPSQLIAVADSAAGGKQAAFAITYGESTDAVTVDYFYTTGGSCTVFLNPYSAEFVKVLRREPLEFDFFAFVLKGHRTLWLPRHIAKPIVGYGVLVFAITLIMGAILWWPKRWTRGAVKQRLTIKRSASLARLNFDLHNVLGGLALPLLLVLCFTGLIWGLSWFGNMVYSATSGGKQEQPYVLPKSDSTAASRLDKPVDILYYHLRNEEPEAKTFYFALPQKSDAVIRVSVVHERGSVYKTDNLFFDRYTLQPLQGQGPYAGKYTEASAADKLRRMNHDIHDGRILGLFGKILMFFASLIGASLPVTGVIIWLRKKKRS